MTDSHVLIIADWLDESAYPTIDTSLDQFAWEFLRRNAKYQEDYAFTRPLVSVFNPQQDIFLPDCDEYRIYRTHCWKYQINELCNPAESYSDELHRRLGLVTSVPYDSFTDRPLYTSNQDMATKVESPGEIVLKFNVRYGIDGLLRVARRVLEKESVQYQDLDERLAKGHPEYERHWSGLRRKLRRQHFPSYLRVLDAVAADVDRNEIGRALFAASADRNRTIRDALETAISIAERDYVYLPLMEN